uniref:Uncharacterized protein n=1 Tax=Micrurus carvalhoi TaxID=3147026 RepID=A0A2H6NI23_9SAUR
MVIWENIYRILGEQHKILKEMTNTRATTSKTGKKPAPTLSVAIISPSNQSLIEGMLTTEKLDATLNMQTMQSTLLAIQETMVKLQENITKNHGEMKVEMKEVKREYPEIR